MNTLIRILLLLLLVADTAAAAEAVVMTIGPSGNVVLQFDGTPPGNPQGDIELTYRAGLMDMLLGRYRITSVHGRRVEASVVSLSAPPSQGMRVMVTAAQAVPLPAVSSGASPTATGTSGTLEGKVTAVQGRAAEIEFPTGMTVRLGDRFSLAYEAPRVGRVAIQGSWRADRIEGNRAHAEPEGTAGLPRVGQIAILLPPAIPADATAPSGLDGGQSNRGGLFQSVVDPKTLSFDAYLAEENYKQGMRWLKGDGVPVDQAKAMQLLRDAAQSGHAGARQQLDALEKVAAPAVGGGIVERGWIGLVLQELTPDLAQSLGLAPGTRGSLVADVPTDGPAEQAGVRPGDVILEFDGQSAIPPRLAEKVRQSAPGTVLRLWVWRGGSRLFIAVRLGKAS